MRVLRRLDKRYGWEAGGHVGIRRLVGALRRVTEWPGPRALDPIGRGDLAIFGP